MEKRKDDYFERREKIEKLKDEQLRQYFWQLVDEILEPILDLAANSTSPSIERSVLLRMGFSSIVSSSIVDKALNYQLLGVGAGNLVLKYAEITKTDYINAGHELGKGVGWDCLLEYVNDER